MPTGGADVVAPCIWVPGVDAALVVCDGVGAVEHGFWVVVIVVEAACACQGQEFLCAEGSLGVEVAATAAVEGSAHATDELVVGDAAGSVCTRGVEDSLEGFELIGALFAL